MEVTALLLAVPATVTWSIDLEERQRSRLAQAWEVLAIDKPGNTGKVESLEYLNAEFDEWWRYPKKSREPLRGIDLSATDKEFVYLRAAQLPEANLSKSRLSGVEMTNSVLRGADLTEADLSGATLNNSDMSRTVLLKTRKMSTSYGHFV